MSDPLVHRHDPAASPPSDRVAVGAPPVVTGPDSADTDAARVVTLAQLLAAESAESAPPTAGTAAEAEASGSVERGGPLGPEPTRYGDWEKGGRCIDF